ncbi:polypeptide N-acetylgalactosaminyltransferase 1-like [Oppia nitens]|uniref:polypeptide N-acetylgalactosaminyltransferase 1-like n=1 Tax=Oppia nitens TaxID=1686743 RepID=UPI0023DC9C8B|nr:polypeptide N-acetylgalactosaminyltransferase 1-like [Oppia nitens]
MKISGLLMLKLLLLLLLNKIICNSILPAYKANQLFEWKYKINDVNPSEWPGELGQKVIIPEDDQTINKYFKLHEFNILVSDRIALNRSLQDSRMKICHQKQYKPRLPKTSVIIVFHNEAFSTLVRTVDSVIKTSSNLLMEIILVDDSSTKVYLRKQLYDYVKQYPIPVRLMRLGRRSGLVRARLLGSAHAKGQVLTFLDSHCECNEGWLEPLLDRIAEDRTRVVCPIIDVIDEHDFSYIKASVMIYGGFNWKIGFRWYRAPERENIRRNYDKSLPLRSPTLSGGLFAIDRDFFEYIGKYDSDMIIWGAENIEFSFRIWMCGGSIEIVTCSRVGHVFRSRTPYTLPGGSSYIVWYNTARLVDVWMDQWKGFFYALHPEARHLNRQSIDKRVAFRHQRQCQSFQWYLDNIYPESQLPKDYNILGDIKSVERDQCLDTLQADENTLVLNDCSNSNSNRISFGQLFMYTKNNQILNDENCLEINENNKIVSMKRCQENNLNQKWIYNKHNNSLIHVPNNVCLDIHIESDDEYQLTTNQCSDHLSSQKWIFEDNFEWQSHSHSINQFDN